MANVTDMDFLELCALRKSVRGYLDTPVDEESLTRILSAARLAPSACNRQPWRFLVLRSPESREKAARCCDRFPWFRQAPVAVICCVDHSQEWVRGYDCKPHGNIDIAIAAEHICLAAAQMGLGTCWICSFDAALCSELFSLPDTLEPAVIIPIGYPDVSSRRESIRKPLEETVTML